MSDVHTEIIDGDRHERHTFDNGLGVHLVYIGKDKLDHMPDGLSEESKRVAREALCLAAPMIGVGPIWMTVASAALPIKDETNLNEMLDMIKNHESLGLDETNPLAALLAVKMVGGKFDELRSSGVPIKDVLDQLVAEREAHNHTIH